MSTERRVVLKRLGSIAAALILIAIGWYGASNWIYRNHVSVLLSSDEVLAGAQVKANGKLVGKMDDLGMIHFRSKPEPAVIVVSKTGYADIELDFDFTNQAGQELYPQIPSGKIRSLDGDHDESSWVFRAAQP